MELVILRFEGFEEHDAIGPHEVFGIAADHQPALSVSSRTLAAADRVTGARGPTVAPDGPLEAVDPDLVVGPGGGWNDRAEAGAWAEAAQGAIPEAIDRLHGEGVTLAGV